MHIQGRPGLLSELKTSLNYVRHCLEKPKNKYMNYEKLKFYFVLELQQFGDSL